MVDKESRWSKLNDVIDKTINDVFTEPNVDLDKYRDLLLDEWILKNQEIIMQTLILKNFQMKIGKFWQTIIPKIVPQIKDLKIGHPSGLDLLRNDNLHFIVELKNRYNTDNKSARDSNFQKLVNYKKKHPDALVIYGVINDKTKEGCRKIIYFQDTEILYLSGLKLFEFLFGKKKARRIIPLLCKKVNFHFTHI